uniref:Uncharacterized protein n=1 Tax=Cacopsylla melanoneura TaxID=428564 RepID=A0A8D9EFM9_9HEMI
MPLPLTPMLNMYNVQDQGRAFHNLPLNLGCNTGSSYYTKYFVLYQQDLFKLPHILLSVVSKRQNLYLGKCYRKVKLSMKMFTFLQNSALIIKHITCLYLNADDDIC